MKKRNYQEFRDEVGSEMATVDHQIPVGQPITQNYASQQQNFYPQGYPNQPQNGYMQQNMMNPPMMMHPQPFGHQQNMPPQPPPLALGQTLIYDYPHNMKCPCCKNDIISIMNEQAGNTTYMWCSFIGCCISPFCCCIPFLMNSCLDKSHYCPNCGHNIVKKHQKCFEFLGC